MKLLTKELRKALPPLNSQEHVADPIVHAKFFTPWSNWTWFLLEFDEEDTFFGYVVGFENELGYFSLSELSAVRGFGGLGVERDLYFKPCPLSVIRQKHE